MDKPKVKVKVVVIGNWGVGKTSMLMTHLFGKFPTEYVPTKIEEEPFNFIVDGHAMTAAFCDTAGGVNL